MVTRKQAYKHETQFQGRYESSKRGLTELLIHVWMIHTDLETVFRVYKPVSLWPWIIPNVGIIIDSCGVFAKLRIFQFVLVYDDVCISNFFIRLIGSIMSLPKTDWPRIFCLVRWYVLRTAKDAVARMPIHGSALSTCVYCRLYVHTRLPST